MGLVATLPGNPIYIFNYRFRNQSPTLPSWVTDRQLFCHNPPPRCVAFVSKSAASPPTSEEPAGCSSASSSSSSWRGCPAHYPALGSQFTCTPCPQLAPLPKTSVWRGGALGRLPTRKLDAIWDPSPVRAPRRTWDQLGHLRAISIHGFPFWILLPNNNKSQVHPQSPTGKMFYFLSRTGGFRCSFYYAL